MESTANFEFDFNSALDSLTRCTKLLSEKLSKFAKIKTWESEEKQALLQQLSELLLDETAALYVTKYFKPIIVELLQRCYHFIQSQDEESKDAKNENFCYIVSILLPIVPHIQIFMLEYLTFMKPFYICLSKPEHSPKNVDRVHMISKTAYNFLNHDYDTFIELWNWELFFKLLDHVNTKIRWLSAHVVAMVTQMSDGNKLEMMRNLFTEDEIKSLTLEMCQTQLVVNDQNFNELTTSITMEINEGCNNGKLSQDDLTENHVMISGVMLQMAPNCPTEVVVNSLVKVPSTQRNLHSLAVAIATGSGVLIEGPVGSGKTCLVEYIAAMTGRVTAPSLMKVQLGDQTDSKSLLGTYICTDTPGEFLWQPGTLLQAVQSGHWVLLEDIDYAPMDVVSILIPLLESKTLSVPGHGNVVKAAPGFQLFATQRTHSHSGYSLHAHSNSSILDRLWTKVVVEPLTKQELDQVITKKFPELSSVSQKLVDVYSMVSLDNRLVANDDISFSSLSHDKRQSTTRDLMKWTSRVVDAPVNGPFFVDGKDAFLEAHDCFGATLSKAEHRLELGLAIGAKLGITKENVEYFCKHYKPKVEISPHMLTVGRISLPRKLESYSKSRKTVANFAHTRHSLVLLERVAACIRQEEPILLVGETGTGKTSSVQNLAVLCDCTLKVINMSQQSDSSDLLGGFKPVEMKQLVAPVRESFEQLFCTTFSRKQNVKYLSHIQQCFAKGQWESLFKLMMHTHKAAVDRIVKGKTIEGSGTSNRDLIPKWQALTDKIEQLRKQQKHAESSLAFQFVEGTLVQAIRNGDWILLDEINLATPETLECLSGLLESRCGSVVLLERGDVEPIVRHENFRLFACMNPATDVGKKDLPPGIRNRFTEIFVDELDDVNDLKTLVVNYLQGLSPTAAIVDGIVRFYLTARHEASDKLTDGTGHKPHYSLRTLCRALRYASSNPHGNVLRSIYEGFCLSFLTQLDRSSHPVVESLIRTNILGHVNATSLINQPLPCPGGKQNQFVNFEGFWINGGEREPNVPRHYVLTESVKANLRDLTRVVSGRSFPVLIQGETSVGKTSLIQWLASSSGNQCVRINNHEHTDIQEYLGCYTSDHDGRLVFKEGVLVDAMRKGYWIILDELNLAPTDVLEALNRLLDDNRELFIAETQETVKAHPNFMLFATQNPPGQYGGRKVLSRAFRNRFVELHFDELPSKELEQILHLRGSIPMSYSKKMVAVMLDLQARRRGSSVFAGKQGFITLRDLFRWAERYSKTPDLPGSFYNWEQHLSEDGYMLLAGRCRNPSECTVIQDVLQAHFKSKLALDMLFACKTSPQSKLPLSSSDILCQASHEHVDGFDHVVWTKSMKRLAVLVGRALQFGEPVLLVGETGCGKTTICQLFAALKQQKLYSVNCHMHSESSDFLGGLRPVRSHHAQEEDGKLQKFFEWCDGPLVLSMKEGAMFLIDEISLADDSVLERLNSVLEPERTLVLAEKGSEGGGTNDKDVDIIVAEEHFRVVATMNPGGDFGKKELSPALRNRFTEIWCPSTNADQDLIDIIEHNLIKGLNFNNTPNGHSGIGKAMVDFVNWFHSTEFGRRFVVSIRDLLSWVRFINTCCQSSNQISTYDASHQPLQPTIAYLHGACLVFLDALGAGLSSLSSAGIQTQEARDKCLAYLKEQVEDFCVDIEGLDMKVLSAVLTDDVFGIEPFYIPRGPSKVSGNLSGTYALNAPTTSHNAQRLLRALQLSRPILLEGSPGVGKTSLVSAIAKASGNELVRINLSEQTDITDLFGADLPVEGGEAGMFTWRDGPLLRALKAGQWIVLDELNLASQSVLEGLNACLDHRAEVYIPELGMSFKVQHEKTRLFACQNPLNQGGGRKGLPKSFLNRFTQVYVEPLSMDDLLFITTSLYPTMERDILQTMIAFNSQLHQETVTQANWGKKGSPWEFNLRDVFRWCDLLLKHKASSVQELFHFAKLIYSDRMRTTEDKEKVMELLSRTFKQSTSSHDNYYVNNPLMSVSPNVLQVGYSFLPRKPCVSSSSAKTLHVLHHHLPYMESLMKCIEMGWMTILVGQRSSGKTSLVQMIAELTGNKLEVLAMNSSMDTTELLGGFEQANLNLHWENLISDTKKIVQRVLRASLLRKSRSGSIGSDERADHSLIYSEWESFSNCSNSGKNSKKEKSCQLTLCKIDQLLVLLEKLAHFKVDFNQDFNTDCLKTRALDLKTRLEVNDGNTHCGGQFEWVDGQLVEALKSGHWLLIDNVNFCSPSVLDRLNALLEPGGVLSINERGVIDGEVPTVKPHPEFRLILTMDPSFGEISRAMRNRGVEIYLSGEDDSTSGYNNYDLQVMINGAGLLDVRTVQLLIAFHKDYKAKVGGSVLLLLHTATMISNLLNRGEDLGTALMTSLNQVYVRSHVVEAERQSAENLVDLYLTQSVPISEDDTTLSGPSPPSVRHFTENSTLAKIRWLSMPLSQLLWKRQSLEYVTYAVDVVMEMSSLNDWRLRYQYVSSLLCDSAVRPGTTDTVALVRLSELVKHVIAKHFDCTLMEELRNNYGRLSLGCPGMDLLYDQPCDVRLLPYMHYLVDWKQHGTEISNRLASLCNRLNLHYQRLKQSFSKETSSTNQKTLLDLSRDYHQEQVSKDMLPHPVIAHLLPFFKKFDGFIDKMLLCDLPLTDDKLFESIESLAWSSRFHNICKTTQKLSLELLSIHWQWMIEKTLRVLPTIMGYNQSEFPNDLMAVINQLSQYMGTDTHMAKVHLQIADNYGHPLAYKSHAVYQRWDNLHQISSQLDLSWRQDLTTFEQSRLASQINLFVNDGSKLNELLCKGIIDVLQNKCVTDETFCDPEFDVITSQITSIFAKYGLLQSHPNSTPHSEDIIVDEDESNINVSRDISMKIAMLPLYDVISSSQEFSIVEELLELLVLSNCTSSDISVNTAQLLAKLDSLVSFLMKTSTRSPQILGVYGWLQSMITQNGDLQAVIKTVESELMYSLLTNESYRMKTLNVVKWAIMSCGSRQSPYPVEIPNFQSADLNSFLFNMLSNQSINNKKSDNSGDSLSSVTIGNHQEKTEQLSTLVRHIWSNADHVTNLTNQQRANESKLLASKFAQVLLSLSNLLETQHAKTKTITVAMTVIQSLDLSNTREVVDKLAVEIFEQYKKRTGSNDGVAAMKILLVQAFDCLTSCMKNKHGSDRAERESRTEIGSSGCVESNCVDSGDLNGDGGSCDDDSEAFTIHTGRAWVTLGLLQTFLLCPIGPVDPVEQSSIELQYSREEISEARQELEVRLYADQLWTGSTTTVSDLETRLDEGRDACVFSATSNPLRVRLLTQKLMKAKEREQDLQRNTAARPSPSQFSEILRSINQYKSTIGNTETVQSLLSCLLQALSSLEQHDQQREALNVAQNIVQRVDMWKTSQEKFMQSLKNDFPLYGDVTGPFVSSVAQVVHGMAMLNSLLKIRIQRQIFINQCPDVQSLQPDRLIAMLCNHGDFLEKGHLEMVKCLVSESTWSCLQGLKSLYSKEGACDPYSELTTRILWNSLLHLLNYCTHHNYFNNKAMEQLYDLLDHYAQQWTAAKEEEEKREQEEGNLFKFKTEFHEGEVDEEKAFEKGLCEAFPTFDHEFSEFVQATSLEEVKEQPKDTNTSKNISDSEKFMKNVDINKICKLHEKLFAHLRHSQSCMLIGGEAERTHGDLCKELFESGYQTATAVSLLNVQRSGDSIGGYMWEPHLLQSWSMLERLSASNDDVSGNTIPYDIYHDINIPEVIKLKPVMTSFKARLDELLAEWPGNPLLTQLQSFMDTILALPVTSPLMKVLTGVELLLKNAQEWENNASRYVSIKEHLNRVINLIIEWRKLELKCWSSLLDVATDKVSNKASQWFFHLYSLVQQTHSTDTQITELIDPLQRFIESSSLGEFSYRMKMLYSFYQQSVAMESTMETNNQSSKAQVSDIILNIYTYYKQFTDTVQQKIQEARTTIEKQLKDYVKIAKWNDANFWAMKQATEKSHRTLHKFVRRYETALSESVRQLLMNTKVAGTIAQDTVETSRDLIVSPDWFISEKTSINLLAVPVSMETDDVIGHVEKLPKLFSRMRKLCGDIVRQQRYSTLVSTLDSFTGEIITNVHELQKLDVTSQPKEKRKEAVKHIHLRKRTALAELFKTLSSIGLSYKKGLQKGQISPQESSMVMPAFQENFIGSLDHHSPSDLVEVSRYHANRCEHYYQRCLARMSALNVHMTSPSKELTSGDIDRCKGFTHHLLKVVQNQRETIVEMAKSVALLRVASRSLSSACVDNGTAVLPPQQELAKNMIDFMEFLSWVTQVLDRSQYLMKCCPKQDFTQESTPVPANMLSAVSTSSTDSDVIQHIKKTLQECQDNVGNLTKSLHHHVIAMETLTSRSNVGNYVLAAWEQVKVLSTSVETLKNTGSNVSELLPHFTSSFDFKKGLGNSLCVLSLKIDTECQRLESWTQELLKHKQNSEAALFDVEMSDRVVTSLLLAVQRISKEIEAKNGDPDSDEDEEGLLPGHLTSHIHQKMINDITKLDLQTVQNNFKTFISHLKTRHTTKSSETQSSRFPHDGKASISWYMITGMVPLLNQFLRLTDSYLLSLLTAHETSCKLLSVLLGVFTELVEKGFCIPPEVEEEESGEGATEFDDIQDGGLGEGQGAKDVSDKIESEDQLQDAKKEGQQDEKQDDSKHEIPEEEHGIEMSEDFDGAMHDVQAEDQDDDKSDDEKEDGEDEMEKQMGELDGKEDEKLDEKMWGDSDDEDKDEKEEESEKGAGAEAEAESQMVAKEDNKDSVDKSKQKEQQEQNDQEDNEDEVNELPKEDSGNLSDEEIDQQGDGKDGEQPDNEANDIDLPDDLALDGEDEKQQDGADDDDNVKEGTEEKEAETNSNDADEESMDVDEEEEIANDQENEKGDEDQEEDDENKDQRSDRGETDDLDENQEGDEPRDDNDDDDEWRTKHETETQDDVQAMDDVTANDGGANQNQVMEQTAGQSDSTENHDQQGVGSAMALGNEGHSGEAEVTSTQTSIDTKQKQRKEMNRSRSDRTLGNMDERYHKRLKTIDQTESSTSTESEAKKTSELYQHLKGDDTSYDAQTLDSATADQTREQDGSRFIEHQSDHEEDDDEDDEKMISGDDDALLRDKEDVKKPPQQQRSNLRSADTDIKAGDETMEDEKEMDMNQESRDTELYPDRLRSTYHVSNEAFVQDKQELAVDAEQLRSDLEHQLSIWSTLDHGTVDEQRLAQSAWHKYELLTSGLAQELCEQLRLVLEPSLATKLKGDYRTGKRLNMRKVIPYIASQFRKDKIWLRRTKPSKREYQVMIAVDDSSSMADNHSKQIAFESLAVISKALTRLEAGDLGVCSFGETVKLLHPLHEPFTDQSGAKILQQFKFDQKKTKIAKLVSTCSSIMLSSQSRFQGGPRSRGNTSQLLLVVSDGRGVFLEGTETVRRAIRAAKEAGIFLVFVVIDNPINRDSILDIKVPIFRPGKPPEIKSYIEQFPFPFYVILRDINALPITLSDALRQWFELVTSMDS